MATAPTIPNTPDTMQGYTFVYANSPLLVFCAAIVSFRVWWRCIKHNGGALNRADICVVIALVCFTSPTNTLRLLLIYCSFLTLYKWQPLAQLS